jgi:type IV pilus assembly protein PilM
MSKATVVGLDFGRGVLRAVEVAGAAGPRPMVIRHHELPLPPGSVTGGEVRDPQAVADVITAMWSVAGFKTKKVVLGMGNQRVLVRELSMPKMPAARMREALPFQVQELLPVPVADALLDFYPTAEAVTDGVEVVNGLLVAAVRGAVEANVEAVRLAGLEPIAVDLIPFALSRLLLPTTDTSHTAIVHIGATTTSVVFVTNGVPQFVRIIPAGGDDVTRALVSRFEIDMIAAERLKREVGLSNRISTSQKGAVETMFEVTGELLTSLRNTFTFYANTRSSGALERVLLSGGGARLQGLASALGEVTRLPVEIADFGMAFDLDPSLEAAAFGEASGDLTVALGLTVGSAA